MNVPSERLQLLINYIRNDELMKFYKSREWMALRQIALKRDNYECQMCKAKGRYHKAENVHHVKEVKIAPHLSLTLDNLLCVCIPCHNEIHERSVNKNKPRFNDERW